MIPCEECISRPLCITMKKDHETFESFFIGLIEKCQDFKHYLDGQESECNYGEQVDIILNTGVIFKYQGTIQLRNEKDEMKEYEIPL